MDHLSDYYSPKSKLTSLVKSGEYIRIKRGLYVKEGEYNLKTLANVIYGPSYISFEYALSHYGLIPERVEAVTSAVYNKNKDRKFDTPVGRFVYRYINPAVYFYGIGMFEDDGETYLMASKEKALCDILYKLRSTETGGDIEKLLLGDLRIDEEGFMNLRKGDLKLLAPMYGRTVHIKMLEYFTSRRKK